MSSNINKRIVVVRELERPEDRCGLSMREFTGSDTIYIRPRYEFRMIPIFTLKSQNVRDY